MDSSLEIKLVEQSSQQHHHQQQRPPQPPPPLPPPPTLQNQQQQNHLHHNQHSYTTNKNNNNNNNNINGSRGGDSGNYIGGCDITSSNDERIPSFPCPQKRPPPPRNSPPHQAPSSQIAPARTTATTIAVTITKTTTTTTNNLPHQSAPLGSSACDATETDPAGTLADIINNVATKSLTTEDLEAFFARGLQNSCNATDELIKSIEESQDEMLARKALNLYQNHYKTLERPWDHETFMYGLGLIYMHFNAYNWAVKSFRDTVYVRPSFPRSRDVHTRLGLIFKSAGRYELSEKHFNLAINDTRLDSGTSTTLELKFHLAHLLELRGNTEQAIELYEKLLQDKDLPQKLSANIHRQLGWIHYSGVTKSSNLSNSNEFTKKQLQNNLSSATRKLDAALNHLNTSYGVDSDSKTSYYLGRCLTEVGKFQDAFAFYRSVIDKEESTADTWCSIGVLYQRQNQPWDALQAYIRSVQYDKKHTVAWMNLGILYESHNQYKDALKCYNHVLRSNSCQIIDQDSLQNRVNYIQKYIDDTDLTSSNNGKSDISSDKLLSLEDLWNMESKTNQDSYSSNVGNSNKSDPASIHNSSLLANNQTNNNQIKEAPKDSHPTKLVPDCHTNQSLQSTSDIDMTSQSAIETSRQCNGQTIDNNKRSAILVELDNDELLSSECKKETTSLDVNGEMAKRLHLNSVHPENSATNLNGLKTTNDCKTNIATQSSHDLKTQPLDSKDFCLNQLFNNGASKDSGISSDSSTYTDCALISSQNTDVNTASSVSGEQVLEACKNSKKLKKIDINLLSDDIRPPSFARHPMYPPLPSHMLLPAPPSIFLDSKKELTSKRLQDICQSNPISIVRNIASVLKLDLGLFSTKTLAENNPEQKVDVVSHLYNHNTDGSHKTEGASKYVWACERHLSSSTISRYAIYQVASFKQSLQDERDAKSKTSSTTKESETDSNESAAFRKQNEGPVKQLDAPSAISKSGPTIKKFKKEESKIKFVKSAYMIDLSDDKKWRAQLNELNKLPHFMKCVSASNMLTHIGLAVPGLNTIAMSMHVPGCKVIGYKTPNDFCSVNINTGPGDYEWSAIPGEYEGALRKLCNRNGCDMEKKNWWPPVQHPGLQDYGIPVYRFTQRPGDLVWINSSTLYWVQSAGWANSIQWNLGPLCAKQFKLASESYELNKLLYRRSEVPLVQMTWNIIINIGFISDDELSWSMVNVLKRSLRYCKLIRDLVDESEQDIELSDNESGPRAAKYCSLCESEVFNITFERKHDDAIHCIECARRADETFKDYNIKQEYDLNYLTRLHDTFISTRKKYQEMRTKQQQQRQ
uniref:Lysine-specific demethylase 6A n=1 Tax=Aceria tosichella TaxID=561515 RepID=A0A6G1SAB5_9ACAR